MDPQIDATQSLHLSNHVPQIHLRGYFCLALRYFFIFFFTTAHVSFWFFVTFLFVIASLFRRRILCMQYFESVYVHATHLHTCIALFVSAGW